jgi:hypothetical protein
MADYTKVDGIPSDGRDLDGMERSTDPVGKEHVLQTTPPRRAMAKQDLKVAPRQSRRRPASHDSFGIIKIVKGNYKVWSRCFN